MTVAGDLEIKPNVVIPAGELQWKFSRSSGPGGQSVNTTDSRVSLSLNIAVSRAFDEYLRARVMDRLSHRLVDGTLTVHAEGERSQLLNRLAAQERLLSLLRSAIAPPPPKRRATKPSRGARDRRIAGKKQRGETKRLRGRVHE